MKKKKKKRVKTDNKQWRGQNVFHKMFGHDVENVGIDDLKRLQFASFLNVLPYQRHQKVVCKILRGSLFMEIQVKLRLVEASIHQKLNLSAIL